MIPRLYIGVAVKLGGATIGAASCPENSGRAISWAFKSLRLRFGSRVACWKLYISELVTARSTNMCYTDPMTRPSTPDPFEAIRAQLIGDLAFGDWTDESEWYDRHSQLEELSVAGMDGSHGIRFNGPPREHAEVDTCPDCGRVIFSTGIQFGKMPESEHSIGVHLHWTEDCPVWKHRVWRIWHIHCRSVYVWARHPVKSYEWWKLGNDD